MKRNRLLIISLSMLVLNCCVQKSGLKTVIVNLDVRGAKNIQTVGLRGNAKPLSWDYDLELKPVIKDTLYTAMFPIVTGYTFIEVKFNINGQFELAEKNNRRITFSTQDTTIYEAKFDVTK